MTMTASQYEMGNRQLLELLIREADVREGEWYLSVTFAFAATNTPSTNGELMPSAILGVQRIGIQRADATTPKEMVLDAATVKRKSDS